jgi:hypothetical protein
MTAETELMIKDLSKQLKEIGYKVKIESYSDFKTGDIISEDGVEINRVQSFADQDEYTAWREKHGHALDIIDKYRVKLFDRPHRVLL